MRVAARRALGLLLTLILGGFLGATLVRLAPGFGVDEQEMDARLNAETIRALKQERAAENNICRFYLHYLTRLLHGDLGISRTLGRPVRELLAERIPVTFRSLVAGLLGGWICGLAFALPAALCRAPGYDLFLSFTSGLFLCLPSAALALLLLLAGGPGQLAIALVVFPRVFRYARNLLRETYASPCILTARAKGLGGARILFWHALPAAAPRMLALAGVSVSLAFGAAIPMEAICDSPGVGQLAWQAALARDLPLLVNLLLLVTIVTLVANTLADVAISAWRPQP